MTLSISLINKSTLLPDAATLPKLAGAITTQVSRDFGPAWGVFASVTVAPPIAVGQFQVVLLDDPDQAGALGYHDRDPHGNPYARVFVKPVLQHGGDWLTKPLSVASVVSHEVLELLADPGANRWADNGTTKLWALEVCDPCENASYPINGVTVSDFVLPAWFDPGAPGPYTHLKTISKPFGLAKGGYAIVSTEGKVAQVFADEPPAPWRLATKTSPASRTARRLHLN